MQELGGGDNHRTTKEAGAVGSIVEPVGSDTVAEGSPTVGGSSSGYGSSGAVGDDPRPNRSMPRDPARGKGTVVEKEETTEAPVTYREEDVLFRPDSPESQRKSGTGYCCSRGRGEGQEEGSRARGPSERYGGRGKGRGRGLVA
ncbi:hypothetical protein RHMOL_Rhmol06G0115000 [Rhododendron molle]|uniref:Uncharacterized protein n=1 Tax=Rhododendron molle TaxID=49168 RepID=A0ACC0NDH0_RHOML|nr:hypothetical protein RHMOL_Rhmol06G0115000 [Rhododendron molle]